MVYWPYDAGILGRNIVAENFVIFYCLIHKAWDIPYLFRIKIKLFTYLYFLNKGIRIRSDCASKFGRWQRISSLPLNTSYLLTDLHFLNITVYLSVLNPRTKVIQTDELDRKKREHLIRHSSTSILPANKWQKNKVKKSDISHARERASEVIAAVRHWKCHATIAREVGQTRVAPRKMFNRCDTGKFCSSISANRSGISFTALEAAVNPSFFHLFLSFYFSRFTLHKWQSPTKTTHTVGRLLWNQPLLALLLVNILSCDNCNLHSHRPCINNSSSSSQARHQQRLNQV